MSCFHNNWYFIYIIFSVENTPYFLKLLTLIYNLKHTGYQSAHFISGVKDVINCDIDVTFLGGWSQVIGYLHGRMSNTRIKISGAQVSTCRCVLATFPTAVIESNNVFIGCPER